MRTFSFIRNLLHGAPATLPATEEGIPPFRVSAGSGFTGLGEGRHYAKTPRSMNPCLASASRRQAGCPWVWRLIFLGLATSFLQAEMHSFEPRSADEYLISSWQTEDGLPDSTATAMVQTPDGYLWFGTFEGLVRFNGVDFKVFTRATTPELPSSAIVNLHLDRKGNLWISTDAGMACLEHETGSPQIDPEHGRWRVYRPAEGWTGNHARTFAENDAGDLFVSSFDGKIFHFRDAKCVELPAPPGEAKGYFALVDSSGALWAAQSKFFGRYVEGRWEGRDPSELFPGEVLIGAGPGRDGSFWVLFENRLRRFRNQLWEDAVECDFKERGFWRLDEDSQKNVWVSSYNYGLFRIGGDGTIRHYDVKNGLTHNSLRFAVEDREANLWVGTSGGGLMKLVKRRFVNYQFKFERQTTAYRAVSEISPGRILVGTMETGAVILETTNVTRLALRRNGRFEGYVTATLVDRAGRYWIGTLQDGVFILDQGRREKLLPTLFGRSGIYALYQDSEGRVWIGHGSGLARSDGADLKHFGPEEGFEPNRINCIAQNPATGAIWVGSKSNGLLEFNGHRFHRVSLEPSQTEDSIFSLLADTDGTLWIGTMSRGLIRLRNGQAERLGTEHGLPACSIGCILDDGLGNLWLGTGRGVLRLSRSDFEATVKGESVPLRHQVFDRNDGLESTECPVACQSSGLRDSQGRLWFATVKSLAMIDPAALRLNTIPPPVMIEEVIVDGRRLHPGDRSGAEMPSRLIIPSRTKQVVVRLAGLSYTAPRKMRFQYQLEGDAPEWRDLGNQRKIEFLQPAPGQHDLRVRASNNDGVWNETSTLLSFVVIPTLRQAWWFRTLSWLMFAWGLGALIWRLHASRLEQLTLQVKASEERRLVDEEIRKTRERFTQQLLTAQEHERGRIARELHDGLAQSLVLLKNHALLAGHATELQNAGKAHIESIVALSTEAIAEVRNTVANLHPYLLDKLGLQEAIRNMVDRTAGSCPMQFRLRIEEVNDLFPKEAEGNIFRLVLEMLNNAIKHSQASEVSVVIERDLHHVLLTVRDNGCGMERIPSNFSPDKSGGLGILSMRERAQMLKATMDIESAPGKGTKVHFRIPLPEGRAESPDGESGNILPI